MPVYQQPHSVLLPRSVRPENTTAPFQQCLCALAASTALSCSYLPHPAPEDRKSPYSQLKDEDHIRLVLIDVMQFDDVGM